MEFCEQTGMISVKHFVKQTRPQMKWNRSALLLLAITLLGSISFAVSPVIQPTITSLSMNGTNLVFIANIPAGFERTILEMRPTVTNVWQEVALLDVSAEGGNVEFTVPRPTAEIAFFRLKAIAPPIPPTKISPTMTVSQTSTELEYITIPSLAPVATNTSPTAPAVFYFKGSIDGSDRILITHSGAFWEHINWGWPGEAVTINGSQWNPREKNYLTANGTAAFLPETYSLENVSLEVIAGRDVVALEKTNNALMVYLNDTHVGAAPYEFKIHFHPVATKPATVRASVKATLKIAARLDGSELFKITAQQAEWTHRTYSDPHEVRLNDVVWNLGETNVLMNTGTNQFLPSDIDFSTARIVQRKGRDLATMWADADAVWINFADNPNGSDEYELELSFGK